MNIIQVSDLLRVKQVIDHLNAVDQTKLTATEQEALCECLEHAYARAESLLSIEVYQLPGEPGRSQQHG